MERSEGGAPGDNEFHSMRDLSSRSDEFQGTVSHTWRRQSAEREDLAFATDQLITSSEEVHNYILTSRAVSISLFDDYTSTEWKTDDSNSRY